jgi:hypothetical protein
VIFVGSFQLVDEPTFAALVVDFVGEVELHVDLESLPGSQLFSAEAVDFRKTTVDLPAVPGQVAHLLELLLADVADEAGKRR